MSDSLTEAVPSALQELDQWVCWRERSRDGKPTKVPIDPQTGNFASTTDAETWAGFDTAIGVLDEIMAAGVGFVFTDDDGFVGVDLDDCRRSESGEADEWAMEIIDIIDSYTEVSPPETGYHVLLRGSLPDGRNRSGAVEMYDSARFFTVTGDHLSGTPDDVESREEELVQVHERYVQSDLADPAVSPSPPDGVVFS